VFLLLFLFCFCVLNLDWGCLHGFAVIADYAWGGRRYEPSMGLVDAFPVLDGPPQAIRHNAHRALCKSSTFPSKSSVLFLTFPHTKRKGMILILVERLRRYRPTGQGNALSNSVMTDSAEHSVHPAYRGQAIPVQAASPVGAVSSESACVQRRAGTVGLAG